MVIFNLIASKSPNIQTLAFDWAAVRTRFYYLITNLYFSFLQMDQLASFHLQELFQSSMSSKHTLSLFPEWKSLGAGSVVVPAMQSSSSPPSTVSSSFSPFNSLNSKSTPLKSTHLTFLNKLPVPTTSGIVLFLNQPTTSTPITSKVDHQQKESRKDPFFREKKLSNLLSSAVESAVVFLASVAISASLLSADVVGPANASVVTNLRKLHGEELATVKLFQENTPSVVYITNLASRQDAFTLGVLEVPQKSGSGFVWDKDGHVVTNYHVIRGASHLRITLADQSTYHACIVGSDKDKDVAVLRIYAPKEKLKPIRIGSSADLLVGQKVYAIGNPFGLDHTLTTGVISGLRREINSAATGRPIQDVIQIDAAINPGNSGGPLLDSSGKLIGINTTIYSTLGVSSGVGFSIPVDTVGGIVDQLVKFGKVTRPVLGLKFASDQSVEKLGLSGVLVLDAPATGPAGKAGLRPTKRDPYGRLVLGDIITSVNGKKVTIGNDLYRVMDQCKVGDTVTVEVLRGDHKENISVVLEPKSDET